MWLLHDSVKKNAEPYYKKLRSQRKTIDMVFGDGLRWEEWRWCSIPVCYPNSVSFSDSEETLAEVRAWAVNQMFKLAIAIPPSMLLGIANE